MIGILTAIGNFFRDPGYYNKILWGNCGELLYSALRGLRIIVTISTVWPVASIL